MDALLARSRSTTGKQSTYSGNWGFWLSYENTDRIRLPGRRKNYFYQGIGKTHKKDFAILENEYGAAGIDADRLRAEEGQSPVNIWEMTEGCICCSAKGDFSLSVLSIANTIDPEYLVIEPTGVGMLGNVMENLKQIEYEHISILAPVTIARYLQLPALFKRISCSLREPDQRCRNYFPVKVRTGFC